MEKPGYLFTSKRLGFRNWHVSDLIDFTAMNADPEVMKHFPKPLTPAESIHFYNRLLLHFDKHGYNYFAVELLETGEWIGFIGLAYQTYETSFTPATDIGWRLKKSAWGKGYATEGATRCLEYGLNDLKLSHIISACTKANKASERVMRKIGMTKKGTFIHPRLLEHDHLKKCVWYEKK